MSFLGCSAPLAPPRSCRPFCKRYTLNVRVVPRHVYSPVLYIHSKYTSPGPPTASRDFLLTNACTVGPISHSSLVQVASSSVVDSAFLKLTVMDASIQYIAVALPLRLKDLPKLGAFNNVFRVFWLGSGVVALVGVAWVR